MSWLVQTIAVTGVNLRSIRERFGSSLVAVLGIVGVVIVFVGVLSIAEGFRSAMRSTGDEDTIMVMRSGADSEMTSGVTGAHARIIMDKPGVARDAAGPIGSPELLVIVNHPLQRSGTDANVPLRGVEPGAFKVHRNVKIVEGHANYLDSDWALTSISQAQFWPTVNLANYGDGSVRGVLSVIISNWNKSLFTGRPDAKKCNEFPCLLLGGVGVLGGSLVSLGTLKPGA